jgi:predicted deacetylase
MTARYLVRFDDVCPTMNWAVWDTIEPLLIGNGVRPLLAVVPDNRDAALEVGAPLDDFWSRVRAWQARGWAIGLHGYQHRYVTAEPGLLGLDARSEFVGLTEDEQAQKLSSALAIFRREGVRADIWIAPGHSFDATTIATLRRLGVNAVSDGFEPFPARDADGTFWVPQQLWRFRELPFGVWTVCMHVNAWGEAELARFRNDLVRYHDRFSDLDDVLCRYGERRRTPFDRLCANALRMAHRGRRWLGHR